MSPQCDAPMEVSARYSREILGDPKIGHLVCWTRLSSGVCRTQNREPESHRDDLVDRSRNCFPEEGNRRLFVNQQARTTLKNKHCKDHPLPIVFKRHSSYYDSCTIATFLHTLLHIPIW